MENGCLNALDVPAYKQNTLLSGENIKTLNGIPLLGNGNINISGSSGNGVSSLNGLNASTQNFVASSPININSNGSNHTFSINYVNTSQNGALSFTDWNTFNSSSAIAINANSTANTAYTLADSKLSAIAIYDEGTPAGNVTGFNFVGSAVTATVSGNITTITINASSGNGGNGITSLNGLNASTQNFINSSPININSSGSNHTFGIDYANTSQNGALGSTDWNTFNNKQNQINGTGFVYANGTTISYNSSISLTAVRVENDGVLVGNATAINFSGVSSSFAGNTANITVPSGGSGGSSGLYEWNNFI